MEKDIGKIKKNDATDIVIRIDDFGGKKGLTIREHLTSERYTGFTKSGTRIPSESFAEFKSMINSIDENELKGTETEKTSEPKKIVEDKVLKKKPKKEKIEEELF